MSSEPTNVVLVMSDEHRSDAIGAAGHPHVSTPHLDELAAEGTRFTNAYCPSPLCAPSRASFVTGQYVHEIGAWDNAASYGGEPSTWGTHFAEHGIGTTTVGGLDFQPGVRGFPEQLLPGFRESPDVNGIQREPPIVREGARDRIDEAGRTEEPGGHEEGDRRVADAAVEWLQSRAAEGDDGWTLWLNFGLPHFPLTAERAYYDRYSDVYDLPYDHPAADDHPIIEQLRDHFDGRDVDEETLYRTRRAYYALCERLDENVGRIRKAIDEHGLAGDTLVIYTSDHGEPLGDHETWWKCNMYEQSVGIPLVAAGADVEHQTVDAPVSLLDLVPTMADVHDIPHDDRWRGVSQRSVLRGERPPDESRAVFSEYHAHGTSRGAFMLREGRYKYVYYPDNPDQLFDRQADPKEMENRAGDPRLAAIRNRLRDRLEERVVPGPDAVDQQAREDQERRHNTPVEEWWGVAGD